MALALGEVPQSGQVLRKGLLRNSLLFCPVVLGEVDPRRSDLVFELFIFHFLRIVRESWQVEGGRGKGFRVQIGAEQHQWWEEAAAARRAAKGDSVLMVNSLDEMHSCLPDTYLCLDLSKDSRQSGEFELVCPRKAPNSYTCRIVTAAIFQNFRRCKAVGLLLTYQEDTSPIHTATGVW